MNTTPKVNRPAPLKNVAAFAGLVEKMVKRDRDLPGLACFYGYSGWGKSRSAIYGANKYEAAYVEVGQFDSARSLMTKILIELGEPNPRGTITEMTTRAIMRMAGKPNRPLIVDEAHFVASKRFVDLLRELSDKSGAAVILIGEEMLPQALSTFERVFNRVLEWLAAQPCDAEDFALLARHQLPNLKIKPDLAAAILSETKGNTRRIVVNLVKVKEAAEVSGLDEIGIEAFGGTSAIVSARVPQARRIA